MLRRKPRFRIAIALFAVFAMVLAGPIHAAHHHASDTLHATCAVCQLHSPACPALVSPRAAVELEPLFTLAASAAPAFHSAPVAIAGTRAPPFSLA